MNAAALFTASAGAGLLAGLAAALLVGALAGWREWSRATARRRGTAVVVLQRSRLRALVRVILLAVAAGSATASVIGLTGTDGAAPQAAAPESILIALDISRSMDATDVAPSRQAAARAWLARLVDRATPRAVGLVLFAGEPLLTCPLTSDLGALRLALDEAGATQMAIPGGSVLGPAIARSVTASARRRGDADVARREDTGRHCQAAVAARRRVVVTCASEGPGSRCRAAPPPASGAAERGEAHQLEGQACRALATATAESPRGATTRARPADAACARRRCRSAARTIWGRRCC